MLKSDLNSFNDASVEWPFIKIAAIVVASSLSRKHAVIICSGAEDSTFPDIIDLPQSNTLIDTILNQFFFKDDSAVYAAVYKAIQGIRKTCLLQHVD